MALFSRLKSKSKKASKEEEKKAAAEAKAAAQPVKAPQRGRNGKIIPPAAAAPEKAMHDIPAPSQLPRHFQSPLARGHDRNYSFEEQSQTDTGKPEYFNPHLSSDSGYASPGADSRVHSRDPSTQQLRSDQDYLSTSKKPMPQLTLGEELAQEPAFAEHSGRGQYHPSENTLKPSKSLQAMRKESIPDQLGPLPGSQTNQYHYQDGRQQRMIQQSMPMRPSSVPAQALQPRHQRVSRPPPQRSSSPGPVLQSVHPALSPRSRALASHTTGSPFDWESPSARNYQSQSQPFQPRLPTSPGAQITNSAYDQDDILPSLNILSGLKVNRRGLILDEEGDPIGELFEGDILDCVRQKADAHGGVLDEYGRVVGRVRTLSIRSPGTSLHRSNTNASNIDHHRSASPAPPVPALSSTREPYQFVEGQDNAQQSLGRTSSQYVAQRDVPSSPTRLPSTPPQHNNSEDEGYLNMRPHELQESEVSQENISELAKQHELSVPRHNGYESSTRRSESLPSVPESRSTAEVALSDNGSATSDESHRAMTGQATQLTADEVASQEQLSAGQGNLRGVEDAPQQIPIDVDGTVQAMRDPREREQPAQVYIPPTISRSVSERAIPSAGLPPVPVMPKNYMEFNRAAHAQPIGQYAAPNRGKAPLPAFPCRGLSVGLAGGQFGNGPMPGMPNRRVTTHGFPSSPAMNMSGLNAQSPFAKSRTSTPLVRSPLSSHGKPCISSSSTCAQRERRDATNMLASETTPPESERGSAQGETRPANRMQGHSRSQSLKTISTTPGAAGAGKPRRVFAKATPDKGADIIVQEMGEDKKADKKKKGMKGFFGKKK
ncbi:hypothetical protein Q7P35_010862 [Cladosporium inversicolor]